MPEPISRPVRGALLVGAFALAAAAAVLLYVWPPAAPPEPPPLPRPKLLYQPRRPIDNSGFMTLLQDLPSWPERASLREVSAVWDRIGFRVAATTEAALAGRRMNETQRLLALLTKAALLNYEGEAAAAYRVLEQARAHVGEHFTLEEDWHFTVVFLQGVTALRQGENENCIACRGASSCIFPIDRAALHRNPDGSRRAVRHFREYLDEFPDDLEVAWLLTLAQSTLGPDAEPLPERFRVDVPAFARSEFDLGQFRDIGHLIGVQRLNQSGGAILEDFHGQGLLDLVVTSFDPLLPMTVYRNKGDGTFEDRSKEAGVLGQVGGGLYCVQTDYNNDGRRDVFIVRGAWLPYPVRPSLLRNDGNGTFTDVTEAAGLALPMNSNSAAWADFDNDGWLDLYICGERQTSRLYRNQRDGTFADVTAASGLPTGVRFCKAATWFDFDNDRNPDLFVQNLDGAAALYRNTGPGTFTDVTAAQGIDGPRQGFACWAFDYDNDGWLDLFATSYDRSVKDIVLGLQGKPHGLESNRLYRNLQGKGFRDVTKEAGLDLVFATMGCNFGDFDNDGYLDMYLGTGEPNLALLVPNRMFKNVAGTRFAEVTAATRTGHLQKGHAVACGDWRRAGVQDIFIQMGGATNGDKYHNVMFLNPGHGNNWLTVKLIGQKTNRAALGARLKVTTAGPEPRTIYRDVTSGSSFGANPLQQTIGLARAPRIASLEVTWPTSGTTQVFRDLDVNQAVEITEFATAYRKLDWKPLPTPWRDEK